MNYTEAWSQNRGPVKFFTRSDGSRLRYFTAGTGPPLVLLHTVRTQLDYFQRVIPLVWDSFTVYALDLPGMGWSDIVPALDTRSRTCAPRSWSSRRVWIYTTSHWPVNLSVPRCRYRRRSM
jgi:pimeloyl-ACP methyl ester carboxylesterase